MKLPRSRLSLLMPGLLCALLASSWAMGLENETIPVLSLRLSKSLPQGAVVEATLITRSYEGFKQHERRIVDLRYGKRIGSNEFSAGYNMQFDRNGAPGSEYRLWQQVRHQFALDGESATIDSSVRLEERYFEATDLHGSRLRVLNRWVRPIPGGSLRFGHEWVFNLDDINGSIQRGVAQNRLIGSLQRNLRSGNRLEFEYQLRYQHLPGRDNALQHQLQLLYVISL